MDIAEKVECEELDVTMSIAIELAHSEMATNGWMTRVSSFLEVIGRQLRVWKPLVRLIHSFLRSFAIPDSRKLDHGFSVDA